MVSTPEACTAMKPADGIRLSYATSLANIEKGLERIERFCQALAK
jgi:hypothetical protein